MDPQGAPVRVLILDLQPLLNLDTTGLDTLHALQKNLQRRGAQLVLAGATEQPQSLLQRSGFISTLGAENVVADMDLAIHRARAICG
jgi:SulP family sulfate permease